MRKWIITVKLFGSWHELKNEYNEEWEAMEALEELHKEFPKYEFSHFPREYLCDEYLAELYECIHGLEVE